METAEQQVELFARIRAALAKRFATAAKQPPAKVAVRRVKRRSRLPALIRKHFLKPKGHGLDIMWLTAVLNLEDKLAVMFRNLTDQPDDSNRALGVKYVQMGVNIWGGQHKPGAAGVEPKKQDLSSLKELFLQEGQQMEFYKRIKNSNYTKEDATGEDPWQMSKAYFDRCNQRGEIPCPTFIKLNQQKLFLSEFKIQDS